MVLKLLLAAITLLRYSQITTADCVHDNLSPHNGNCEQYFRCIYGTLYELSCPNGLHFNAESLACDSPDNANCMPKAECVNDDLLPHAENCELFYKCSEGSLQVLSCPGGLHFNPIEKQCDWPAEAKCAVVDEKCVDGELFPHENSCELFYQCSGAALQLHNCTDGLHFDPTAKQCNWPGEAKCGVTVEKCVDGDLFPHEESCEHFYLCSGAALQLQSCPDGLHFSATDKQCDWPFEAKCAVTDNKCVDGDLFPHEERCDHFYQCSGSALQLQTCPEGLHFSSTAKHCDWPNEAKCEKGDDKCTDGDLHPHKEACELFYQCSGGSYHLQSCPAGLHFNSVDSRCDFPENVHCDVEVSKCTDGDLIPHSESCSQFFLCAQGGLYLISCPDGYYFDASQKVCALGNC